MWILANRLISRFLPTLCWWSVQGPGGYAEEVTSKRATLTLQKWDVEHCDILFHDFVRIIKQPNKIFRFPCLWTLEVDWVVSTWRSNFILCYNHCVRLWPDLRRGSFRFMTTKTPPITFLLQELYGTHLLHHMKIERKKIQKVVNSTIIIHSLHQPFGVMNSRNVIKVVSFQMMK